MINDEHEDAGDKINDADIDDDKNEDDRRMIMMLIIWTMSMTMFTMSNLTK